MNVNINENLGFGQFFLKMYFFYEQLIGPFSAYGNCASRCGAGKDIHFTIHKNNKFKKKGKNYKNINIYKNK